MAQQSYEPSSRQRHILRLQRSPLLQRHPILIPFLLLSGSVMLGIASFSVDDVFPVFAFIGAPTGLLCLLLAFVLGTSGILVGIISIIEFVDRYCLQGAMFPQSKEHSYDSH
jgi:hypothetical protein